MQDSDGFSAIVVTYNEAFHLGECLDSLSFCKELLVFDLGSSDASCEIAHRFHAEVRVISRKPIVEQVWAEVVEFAENDWIIFLDPDEVFPGGNIEESLWKTIEDNPDAGVICLPWHFYFKGNLLNSTRWGIKPNYKWFVRHRTRVNHQPRVHNGVALLPGFRAINLSSDEGFFVKHYWVDSYRQLFTKHWRYVKNEGRTRFHNGERFWPRRLWNEPRAALMQNLVEYGGIKGGALGIFLSFFYSWYVAMSLISLWVYQKRSDK